METENNNSNNNEPKGSWFQRNLWWVALFIAMFLVRMCNELAR